MTAGGPAGSAAACLAALETALAAGALPDLGGVDPGALDEALKTLGQRRSVEIALLCQRLAREAPTKELRKAARRALYRLALTGVEVARAAPAAPRPVVERHAEHPVRAWLSGIDGSGSRVTWILFSGGLGGGLALCSLVLNDEVGILDAAGGAITKKRLEVELRKLRESQKLPWVETSAARACALVAEALAHHARAGTAPPAEFARWRRLFGAVPPPGSAVETAAEPVNPLLLERSVELLELPELAGWFVDPAACQADALALLQARESRLIVSDQIKAEREAAIVDGVIERAFTAEARMRWVRRLTEMALIFRDTDRAEPAELAETAARALRDPERRPGHVPLARAMALRGLQVAAEVALGQASLDQVSRAPVRRGRRSP
jgi:hypothetical protein